MGARPQQALRGLAFGLTLGRPGGGASSALIAGLVLAGCGTPGVGALPRRNSVTEISTPGASHQVARLEICSASSCAPPRCRAEEMLNAADMSA